jgi:hypothetical protein
LIVGFEKKSKKVLKKFGWNRKNALSLHPLSVEKRPSRKS